MLAKVGTQRRVGIAFGFAVVAASVPAFAQRGCDVLMRSPFSLLATESARSGTAYPAQTHLRAIAFGSTRRGATRAVRVTIDPALGWVFLRPADLSACAAGSIAARPGDLATVPGGPLPAHPDRSTVILALHALNGAVHTCRNDQPGTATVTFDFDQSGHVTAAAVSGIPAGPVSDCVVAAARTVTLPPFSNPSYRTTFSYQGAAGSPCVPSTQPMAVTDFNVTCQAASDCTTVNIGHLTGSCRCDDAAINHEDLPRYQRAVAARTCGAESSSPNVCACRVLAPRCVQGVCTM